MKLTNGKCINFVNGNCSINCPNAKLKSACDYWDLDVSDFGMEIISCKECSYSDEYCSCDDCCVNGVKGYCPKCNKED